MSTACYLNSLLIDPAREQPTWQSSFEAWPCLRGTCWASKKDLRFPNRPFYELVHRCTALKASRTLRVAGCHFGIWHLSQPIVGSPHLQLRAEETSTSRRTVKLPRKLSCSLEDPQIYLLGVRWTPHFSLHLGDHSPFWACFKQVNIMLTRPIREQLPALELNYAWSSTPTLLMLEVKPFAPAAVVIYELLTEWAAGHLKVRGADLNFFVHVWSENEVQLSSQHTTLGLDILPSLAAFR